MYQICLATLVGLPASGKTTFCQRILSQSIDDHNYSQYNLLHICYDDFIIIPTDPPIEYFQSKTYKTKRVRLAWTIKSICDLIQNTTDPTNGNHLNQIEMIINQEFPDSKFTSQRCANFKCGANKLIILIDDTMHLKSMRKQMRMIAVDKTIGHIYLYLHSTCSQSLVRNSFRTQTIQSEFIEKMFHRFEQLNESEGKCINLNDDIDNLNMMEIIEIISNEMRCPSVAASVASVATEPLQSKHEQSAIHKIDLILRQLVGEQIAAVVVTTDSIEMRLKYAQNCRNRRQFLLQQFRDGHLNVDDYYLNVNELKLLFL